MRHLWVNDLSLTLTLVFSAIALGVVCISRLEGQIDQLFLPCFSLFVLLLIVLSASFIYLNVFPPFILSTKIHSLRAYRIVFRYTAHFLLIKLYLPCVQASLKLINMYRPNIRNNGNNLSRLSRSIWKGMRSSPFRLPQKLEQKSFCPICSLPHFPLSRFPGLDQSSYSKSILTIHCNLIGRDHSQSYQSRVVVKSRGQL